MAATSKASASQLPRKGTAKVLILESRASSQLLHTPTKGSPLPISHANEHRMTGAQRKLVFSGEHCSCCHHNSKRKSSRSLAAKRTRSPEEETPTGSRKHYPRLKDEVDHCDKSYLGQVFSNAIWVLPSHLYSQNLPTLS